MLSLFKSCFFTVFSVLLSVFFGLMTFCVRAEVTPAFKPQFEEVTFLSERWTYYDTETESYLPYLSGSSVASGALYNYVVREENDRVLYIPADSGTAFYVSGRFVDYTLQDTVWQYNVSTLFGRFANSSLDKLTFSLYHFKHTPKVAYVAFTEPPLQSKEVEKGPLLSNRIRTHTQENPQGLLLSLLFLAGCVVIVRVSFRQPMERLFLSSDPELANPYTSFYWLLSLIAAGIIAIGFYLFNVYNHLDINWQHIANYLMFIVLFLLGRTILISLTLYLIRSKGAYWLHFHEMIRAFVFLMALIWIFSLLYLTHWINEETYHVMVYSSLGAAVLLELFSVLMAIYRANSFKNVYIFFYLCISVVVPFVIIGKLYLY